MTPSGESSPAVEPVTGESSAATAPHPSIEAVHASDLRSAWRVLSRGERLEAFRLVPRRRAESFFLRLSSADKSDLLLSFPSEEHRSWVRLLAPDDAADVIQAAPHKRRAHLIGQLDTATRNEVQGLLAYAEDEAGGIMNPRYPRVRPDMKVDEAIAYLRKQTRTRSLSIHYIYVLDSEQHLKGVVSFRELIAASSRSFVRDVMKTEVVAADEEMDQEAIAKIITSHRWVAVPVVDADRRMKGVVTVDDIVDVVQEEATEDIQKMGGTAALDEPYLEIGIWKMMRKRGVWLAALFVGEMLTASAMGFFEKEIAQAVVLALFIPLIISSGGNSGSQATTLIIRAMALGEVRLRDWWRVARRELGAGLVLGSILGVIGFMRIVIWQPFTHLYGEHFLLVALVVALSLLGVVTWGTLTGSLLPFALRRLGFDPASASAPFVATLVDVAGILIYFSLAAILLAGKLL